MKKNFKIEKRSTLYKGFFSLDEIILKHIKHDGKWSNLMRRELFSGAQVSAVLPYDPLKKKIILIKQFRPGVLKQKTDPILDEIVAGIIDKGETPRKAAIRECEEETNCKISKLKKICSYFPAPASSESFYHLFIGEVKSFTGTRITGKINENENILVKCYSINQVKKLLDQNKIVNGLTLIALQWFFLNYYKN